MAKFHFKILYFHLQLGKLSGSPPSFQELYMHTEAGKSMHKYVLEKLIHSMTEHSLVEKRGMKDEEV